MTSPLKIEGTPFSVWESCKFTHVDDFTILTRIEGIHIVISKCAYQTQHKRDCSSNICGFFL